MPLSVHAALVSLLTSEGLSESLGFSDLFLFPQQMFIGQFSSRSRRLQSGHIKGSCSSHGDKDVLTQSQCEGCEMPQRRPSGPTPRCF